MREQVSPESIDPEQGAYLEVAGNHLYTVLHAASSPFVRVLLVGAFAPERSATFLPLVRWARYLASRQVEVLRFDHRGVGESTGDFQDMSFSAWQEDVESLSQWFRSRGPSIPVLLHGLGLGALVAAKAFERGAGNGLLLWSPPANANAALRSSLKNWWLIENLKQIPEERKPLSHYTRTLDEGGALEINGYPWTSALWRDSLHFALPSWAAQEKRSDQTDRRPIKVAMLGKEAVPLVRGGIAGYEESNNLDGLYAETFSWLQSTFLPS